MANNKNNNTPLHETIEAVLGNWVANAFFLYAVTLTVINVDKTLSGMPKMYDKFGTVHCIDMNRKMMEKAETMCSGHRDCLLNAKNNQIQDCEKWAEFANDLYFGIASGRVDGSMEYMARPYYYRHSIELRGLNND